MRVPIPNEDSDEWTEAILSGLRSMTSLREVYLRSTCFLSCYDRDNFRDEDVLARMTEGEKHFGVAIEAMPKNCRMFMFARFMCVWWVVVEIRKEPRRRTDWGWWSHSEAIMLLSGTHEGALPSTECPRLAPISDLLFG